MSLTHHQDLLQEEMEALMEVYNFTLKACLVSIFKHVFVRNYITWAKITYLSHASTKD